MHLLFVLSVKGQEHQTLCLENIPKLPTAKVDLLEEKKEEE